MGAGRRTSTYDIDTGAQQLGFVERQRNLGENLGGVIFGMPVLRNGTASTEPWQDQLQKLVVAIAGCSHETYDECVSGLIFGLPRPHICYVQYIVPG